MKRFIKTCGILFSVLLVVGICMCMADFPTMESVEKKVEAMEKANNKTVARQEKKTLSEGGKKEELIKILDPDGTLGLEIIDEGVTEDGEFSVEACNFKVDTKENHKILWERLKKYHTEIIMLDGDVTEDTPVEVGTSKRVD